MGKTVRKRHTLTVVFSDLSESTKLVETMDLEDYEAFLEEIRERAYAIITQKGGTIVRIDGDGILFIFGYPDAHEDAVRRAIDATLELTRWIEEFSQQQTYTSVPVKLHSGINSGVVLLKDGDLARGKYEILGDTTNVASRLSSHANPGEIVISIDALGNDRHFYDTSAPELTSIRSRRNGKYVCKILGERNSETSSPRNLRQANTRLVARKTETKRLEDFLARRSQARVIHVRAEAGMGKSRLLSESVDFARHEGSCIAWSYCSSYEGDSRLFPVKQLLASLHRSCLEAGLQTELSSEIERFLYRTGGGKEIDHDGLVTAFRLLAAALNQTHTQTVLFLDDWHWADTSSINFIDYLKSLSLPGILLVIAERFHKGMEAGLTQEELIELKSLRPAEARRLVEQLEPTIDPLSIDEIIDRGGGNPLFLEELSHAAKWNLDSGQDLQSDAWVHTVIQSRFHLLSPEEQAFLEYASIIGQVVPKHLLGAEFKPRLEDMMNSLEEKNFLIPDDNPENLRFKHGITAEAVFNHVPSARKIEISKRIASQLEASPSSVPPGDLAKYYFGSKDAANAVRYATLAGSDAVAAMALDKAQFHLFGALSHAVDAGLQETEIVRLLKMFGQVCIVDPAKATYDKINSLRTKFGDAKLLEAEVWAGYFLAFLNYGIGKVETALNDFEAVRDEATERGVNAVSERVTATLGQVYAAACRGLEALPVMDASIQIQQRQVGRKAPPTALAYTIASKGHLLMDIGQTGSAHTALDQAIELVRNFKSTANLSIMSFVGAAYVTNGEFIAARKLFKSIHAMADSARSRFHLAQSSTFLKIAEFYLSKDVSVLDELELSTRKWEVLSQHHLSIPYGHLAENFARFDRKDSAKIYIDKALARASEGDRFGETMAYRALAITADKAGERELFESALINAYRSAEFRGSQRATCITGHFESQVRNKSRIDWQALATALNVDPLRLWVEAT